MIGERRANQLRAQSREPLNCRLDAEHTSDHGECCAHVESTRWATGGGDKGMLRPTLYLRIIIIIVKLFIVLLVNIGVILLSLLGMYV